ncbi:acyl carrier protein [Microbacterium sp. AZCO]|uniref:acyl carrier protein n=1 Tax=Microbacterium sp. AZCO TaxID=3142976 RepID=UPI0031F3665F
MTATLETVRVVLVEALELPYDANQLDAGTALFGAMPELDSFGVLQVVAALEERFDIRIEDDEFGADLFETVGTLSDFVDAKLAVV